MFLFWAGQVSNFCFGQAMFQIARQCASEKIKIEIYSGVLCHSQRVTITKGHAQCALNAGVRIGIDLTLGEDLRINMPRIPPSRGSRFGEPCPEE